MSIDMWDTLLESCSSSSTLADEDQMYWARRAAYTRADRIPVIDATATATFRPTDAVQHLPIRSQTNVSQDSENDVLMHISSGSELGEPVGLGRACSDREADAQMNTATMSHDGDNSQGEVMLGMPTARFVASSHRYWWMGEHGVIDLRAGPAPLDYAGLVLEDCRSKIEGLISTQGVGHVRFKIGMAACVFTRWLMYVSDSENFSHMFLLHSTQTREGAFYLECTLIGMNWDVRGCVNAERKDRGGTGPRGRTESGPCGVYIVARRMYPS